VSKSTPSAEVSVTSVKTTSGSTVITVRIQNGDEVPFGIWSCCTLVEQPSGKQRDRSNVNGGDLPDSSHSPVAVGTAVTGTVRFGGGLQADTKSVVLSLQYQEGTTMPAPLSVADITLSR
jgi:hypothetical protein